LRFARGIITRRSYPAASPTNEDLWRALSFLTLVGAVPPGIGFSIAASICASAIFCESAAMGHENHLGKIRIHKKKLSNM
jgi:hypothetical protein